MHCVECPGPTPNTDATSVDVGVAGRSAFAEYERRVAKRETELSERWGEGFTAKVVRALTNEPQSTRAWSIGAAGEEKLAREPATVAGIWVLNDRRVPGTKGNIDHVVISPGGVFVVDAKNHKGVIAIRNRGGLLRPDHRLTVGGRDCSSMADKMEWQLEAVRAALHDNVPAPPIAGVLCFLGAEWPLVGAPREFRGVRLESHRSLKRLVAEAPMMDEARVDQIARALAVALPSK
jgi:hypothetical protein